MTGNPNVNEGLSQGKQPESSVERPGGSPSPVKRQNEPPQEMPGRQSHVPGNEPERM
jgi:hypothetical protein